jgi:two-component system, chemotaxis family, chemotaxis protein CheY
MGEYRKLLIEAQDPTCTLTPGANPVIDTQCGRNLGTSTQWDSAAFVPSQYRLAEYGFESDLTVGGEDPTTAVPSETPAANRALDLRILVVDDSETTRRILRAIVQSRSWTVCGEAENGVSGIKLFQKLQPDLVLIDLAMPDINGVKVAERMSVLNPKIPLILFTVLDLQGLEKAARDAGIFAVVSKAQAWDLITTIESAVAKFYPDSTEEV